MATIQIEEATITETEREGVIEYAWNNTRIYRIPVESYPGHITNVYLILDEKVTLIDTGLDGKKARADLEKGIELINSQFAQRITFEDIGDIIITHGHADHWGMLSNPKLKGKKLYIHELDSEVLQDFQARYARAKDRIKQFVKEAGWDLETDNIFDLDKLQIQISDYELIEITEADRIVNGYEVYHVPGHSPGHILLKIGPFLFLGDHILSKTTPHQLPGSLIEGCGLRLYRNSLRKAADLGEHLGLPAHEDTIYSIKERVEELEVFHSQRVADILDLCTREKSLFRITDDYYRLRSEYINGKTVPELARDDQILALEEIRSHLDYLMEEGKIVITGSENGVLQYRTK
jgi:glyoxylase-like metal-dependent hydrolase (beta-lactamase superfamily II)